MNVSNAVTTDYAELPSEATVSKVVGVFEDPSVRGIVVGDRGGVLTRRQFLDSHHPPGEKVGSLARPVPEVHREADVRTVARLMLDAETDVLPVVEDGTPTGVVTVDGLLNQVRPFLDAVDVGDVYTADPIVITPETTLGEAVHRLRDHRIGHLPVVEGNEAVGMLSLHDLTGVVVRERRQSQGGRPPGFDGHGGAGSRDGYRSHGGFGAREGERVRVLDLPARDFMSTPVRTTTTDRSLSDALAAMFRAEVSSLVVTDARDGPAGIVTKSDVLRTLIREEQSRPPVQVSGVALLDDVREPEVAEMLASVADRDRRLTLLDATVHLEERDERHRGTPLLQARVRLYTDRGFYVATGDGYGAGHALREATDILERRVREDKRDGKRPPESVREKRFGWWLGG